MSTDNTEINITALSMAIQITSHNGDLAVERVIEVATALKSFLEG